METLGSALILSVIAVLLTLLVQSARRRALGRLWKRHCMGIRWRRRFPDAPKAEIRKFLTIFTDAFCVHRRRRTCFSPDDRVMDVYRANQSPGHLADSMELEALGLLLHKQYGIDLPAVWREDLALGELYGHTNNHRA